MKGFSMLTVATLLAALLNLQAALGGQSQPTATELNAAETPFILVELSDSLNAKKLKPGDRVKAQVAQDVLAHGRIIIPAEAKLLGHVTEARARGGESTESRLGLVFDKVLLKNHEERTFQGVVHSVAPPIERRSRFDELGPMPMPNLSRNNGPMPLGGSKTNQPRQNPTTQPAAGPINPIPSPDTPTSSEQRLPGTPGYSPGAGNSHPSDSGSLSVGTRQGVFGLKGLSLRTETSGSTPGPVIVSKVDDVKLQSGSQVLLKVLEGPATRP